MPPSLIPSLTLLGYKSILGAGTDDKTSYHPFYDFCGEDRADRPDCLFSLKQPKTIQDAQPATYLVWNGKVVLDYRVKPIRNLGLPLTISSEIGKGKEEARLEAMLRFVGWDNILARILRRGDDAGKARRVRNALNMRLVRFRVVARLISRDATYGSAALETYLFSVLTAEMIVKNTNHGIADLAKESDERQFIELLNAGIKTDQGQIQTNESGAMKTKMKEVSSQEGKIKRMKKVKERIQRAETVLRRAEEWAQARADWEAQNPVPEPSIYGPMDCEAIEAIVAFKLASLNQYCCDGRVAFNACYTLPHGAPTYSFDNAGMEQFFGSQSRLSDPALLHSDSNDPYGVLGSPTVTAAQTCIVDFLLEPARMQYRRAILVGDGFGGYQPVFTTNPNDSYWKQLEMLQSAFEQHWEDVRFAGHPPKLCGLLKLDYGTMTWNTNELPYLALVWQSIDSCSRTLAIWQRSEANRQEQRLIQLHRDLDDEEKSFQERAKKLRMEVEGEASQGDADIEEGGGAEEDVMEVE